MISYYVHSSNMAARGDNNFMIYVYMGEEGEVIPQRATHIFVHESVTVIRARAFYARFNIVEVICHEAVEKIERSAFHRCLSLRRVIMTGVTIVEGGAFHRCDALTDVECGKLEIIKHGAFFGRNSLRSINLPSARIIEMSAFGECTALMDATFGNKLERIEEYAFCNCPSLERITIPLRDGLIAADNTFQGCENLNRVNLVEGELHETIAALHIEDWRKDMNKEIDSINQVLPNVYAGYYEYDENDDYDDVEVDIEGEKAQTILVWIGSLLEKILDYKAEHRRLLDENVAPILQRFVPQDIVMNSILPFLELPSNSFEVGDLTLEGR